MSELKLPDEPQAKLSIKYAGEDRECFMSFLRLNALIRVVGDISEITKISIDPDLGEMTLQTMLAPSVKNGAHLDFELDDQLISGEDVELVLSWAQDHLMYFFVKRFQQMGAKAEELEPLARALLSLVPGSATSPSETTSVGPSELSPAA